MYQVNQTCVQAQIYNTLFYSEGIFIRNEDCKVGFDSQNQSFIETEQPPDGSISVITAGVAESSIVDYKNPRENTLFFSIYFLMP